MGTINYKTSEYITIGYNCNMIDYEEDFYSDIISDYYKQACYTLEKYNFNCFNVDIEPGYYEGFSVNIEFDYNYFDDYEEKQEAQKEITQIKHFLLECVNDFECVAVFPGWCTGYADYKTTLQKLSDAVREMRAAVKNTPTWNSLQRNKKTA